MPSSNYSVEDFVVDEDFIRWVKSPNESSNAFWNSWISQNPHKREDVYKAREIVLLLDVEENVPPEGRFLEIWEGIATRTNEKNHLADSSSVPSARLFGKRKIQWYQRIAAVLLAGMLVFGGYLVYDKSNTVVIRTAYGESRTFFLPDSTKVTLNANSGIRYTKSDFENHERRVGLNGEAFFSVIHKANHENFEVHTSELEVEVLGTRFDVNSRRGITKVVLEEGKVKLDMNRSEIPDAVHMRPGEFVSVSGNSREVKRKLVNPDEYSSWRNNRLQFNSTSLREIANLIEDNYGYKVILTDEVLAERKFTGSGSADDLRELTGKLTKIFDLNITQKGNVITINKD